MALKLFTRVFDPQNETGPRSSVQINMVTFNDKM